MQFKDYFTLAISLVALGVSLYSFYAQQLRRREKLIGSMFSIGVNEGKFDRRLDYMISNTGDVQLVVKEAELSLGNGEIIDTETKKLPRVLKPGEMTLFEILYNSSDNPSKQSLVVDLGVFSTSGKGYRLTHDHDEKGFGIFELKKEHEGY